jgi:hypothetical protein
MSLKFLEYILDSEKPNFVAFTGDQVNGDTSPNAKSVPPLICMFLMFKAIFKFAELCIDRQIPYAAIFGNHDDEGDLSREELMEVLTELPYCVAKPGLKEIRGVGNYVVAIEKQLYPPPLSFLTNIKDVRYCASAMVSRYP